MEWLIRMQRTGFSTSHRILHVALILNVALILTIAPILTELERIL